jgi:transglutaminase-like putative cysteine protease
VKYHIHHETRYRYSESVSSSQHDMHLLPRELPHQRCLWSKLTIEPMASVCQERLDYFGNRACHMVLSHAHVSLTVRSESLVDVRTRDEPPAENDRAWEAAAEEASTNHERIDVQEMTFASPLITPWPELRDYAKESFPAGRPTLQGAIDLMARVHRDFTYDAKATTIATPIVDVFNKRRGVCQDFSHIMIAGLRALGLAARYVSGYLVTTPPPGRPRLVGVDASHAWLSVYSPHFGFVDLDPTNNIVVGDTHVTLAVGRDFSDVTPLRGVILGGGKHELHVAVDVAPEQEPPERQP